MYSTIYFPVFKFSHVTDNELKLPVQIKQILNSTKNIGAKDI